MSDKAKGFRGLSIVDVQRQLFQRNLPANGGRFRYPKSGLNARAGTVVLFQYQARIIASGTFIWDERFERPVRGFAGALHFDPKSIKTFDPVDADSMRQIWPAFRSFGHVKQFLNPARYATFKRRLKRLEASLVNPPNDGRRRPPNPPAARRTNTPTARKRSR
jgi:hypothetical protein